MGKPDDFEVSRAISDAHIASGGMNAALLIAEDAMAREHFDKARDRLNEAARHAAIIAERMRRAAILIQQRYPSEAA